MDRHFRCPYRETSARLMSLNAVAGRADETLADRRMKDPRLAIHEGLTTACRYTITAAVYEQFLATFGDTNRLHTEDDFARTRGFPERVMHGAILNGFISHFVGVHF